MIELCGKRAATGLDRCTLPPDHNPKGVHKDESTGAEWGTNPNLGSGLSRGRLRKQSDTEALGAAYREGRKDERIFQMFLNDGFAYCQASTLIDLGACHVSFTDPDDALSGLDYAHLRRRSQAQGYRPGKGGQNDREFKLLCRSHHEALDGSVPRFWERAS